MNSILKPWALYLINHNLRWLVLLYTVILVPLIFGVKMLLALPEAYSDVKYIFNCIINQEKRND